ncbi:uncharacterized protein EDB91DRAFT_1343051 [Suillus paluster]|uniref:uncharacterized protein n=1 Tax=Suillus paluster TaxID=48578 RepID=UPI001B85F793|nr:uncharacterized protein EDB91DRAFT_1343051 [Suillus paluster]KAG1753637.1 hypothetical protein EDB91DRAFT_1343051 [Suillus paluster]
MDVPYGSSPAPQVTDNTVPSTEDASTEAPQAPEPAQRSPPEPSSNRDKQPSLQEILQMTSTTVTFISTITTLFHEKGEQNTCFREELRRKILFTAMNAHAWASARIVHEHTTARDTLETGIQKLVEDEKDQGRSSYPVPKSTFGYVDFLLWLLIIALFPPQDRMRARLSEMFEAINNTVASLTGLG